MGSLTRRQRLRLARDARKLAMECLTNGPEMQDDWCGCAIGISLKRAGLQPVDDWARYALGGELEGLLDPNNADAWGILSTATRDRMAGSPTAVVIPLLAWADALEEAQP